MAAIIPIDYYNTFWTKKVGYIKGDSLDGTYTPTWPGIFYNPPNYTAYPINATTIDLQIFNRNWYVEEARIRGGYNNTTINLGPRAYLDEKIINQQHRFNALIYSGIYNSVTGFNQTNVFSVGENITKAVDPSFGSIQKLYQSDNDLTILQENKVSRALVDKDALYTAAGSASLTSTNRVIGQVIPFNGVFGISKNPESFASFGFRKYFSDVYRGKVMRLSKDGLTEISDAGMEDYFRDFSARILDTPQFYTFSLTTSTGAGSTTVFNVGVKVSFVEIGMKITVDGLSTESYVVSVDITAQTVTINTAVTLAASSAIIFTKPVKDKVIGGWDNHNRQYTIAYNKALLNEVVTEDFTVSTGNSNTLSFDESVKGWNSFYTYRPNDIFSSKGNFYTIKDAKLWKHYYNDVINNNSRGKFYDVQSPSSIEFVINNNPSTKKVFQTVNYEGDNGYQIDFFKSDIQRVDADLPASPIPTFVQNNEYQDTTPIVYSYYQGEYTDPTTGQPQRAGFDRKENLYVANLINNSTARPDEVVFGSSISGIKGYFATVKISTDNYTDVGGLKELWSVGSKFVQSS